MKKALRETQTLPGPDYDTGQLGHGLGTRGFRGPALSKVKEMCRHSYSLSHEKSEKMFWIVTCFMYPRMLTKEGSCGDCCLSCDSSFLLIG